MFSKLIRFHLMLIYHHRWDPSSGGQRTVPDPHDLRSFLINHVLCTGHFSSNALNGPEWSIGLGHGNRLGFSGVIFPVMVIWKVKKSYTVWRGQSLGFGWLQHLPPPCPPCSAPTHPPPLPILPFPFTIQSQSRIQRISLQNQFTKKCIMVHKCQVQFILNFRQCFSFKKSSFKCPVLLTFSYIFYSVFEEGNNLCLILGNSCKDNEILMIFHQVKCELQKKSYWIFMDLNRIKWDSWGIRITILGGPAGCTCGKDSLRGVRGAPASARKTLPKRCLQLALRVIMKYDRNFLVLDQWQERSCTADINSSDLCSRSWFTLWLKTCAGLLTNWNQISSAAQWYWSLFNIKAQNWLALINNKNALLHVQPPSQYSERSALGCSLHWPIREEKQPRPHVNSIF